MPDTTRRTHVTLQVNQKINSWVDSAGTRISDDIEIWASNFYLLQIQMFAGEDRTTTPVFDMSGFDEFYLGIDSEYGSADADLAAALNAEINQDGDWIGGANPAPASGQFTARLATNTVALLADLGTSPSADMHLGIWGRHTPTGNEWALIVHVPITIKNIATSPNSPASGITLPGALAFDPATNELIFYDALGVEAGRMGGTPA